MSVHEDFMARAIQMARKGMNSNSGGPFGAIIVKDGSIIAEAHNEVTSTNDPTAHAEVVAIRRACEQLDSFQLEGCTIYTSCEPCPMCLGAIYWARPDAVYYACRKDDAAKIEFDDGFIYQEIETPMSRRKIPFVPLMRDQAITVFQEWSRKEDKERY